MARMPGAFALCHIEGITHGRSSRCSTLVDKIRATGQSAHLYLHLSPTHWRVVSESCGDRCH